MSLEEGAIGKRKASLFGNRKGGHGRRVLEDTLLRHFSLFEASIPDDVRELKSDVTIDVSPLVEYEAIEVPEIRLIRCQTEDPNLQEGLGEFDDTLSLRRMFRVWHLRGMYDWIGYSPYYGISDFLDSESFWGFFMYCYIGTLLSNRDLSAQGLEIGERALGLGHIVLPPRPMINLILGETTSSPHTIVGRGTSGSEAT